MNNGLYDIDALDFNVLQSEHFLDLLVYKNIKIERIVSCGHVTKDEWLQQSNLEWVVVVQGEACVKYDNGDEFYLSSGTSLSIAPFQKHKVTYTSTNPVCIWLAIHVF